jgi:transcriptional regulatory protein LevR
MWTGSLKGDITEVKKDFYEAIANTRKDFQEELGLMLQVDTQTTKALIEAIRREFQAQLKEIKSVIHVTIH